MQQQLYNQSLELAIKKQGQNNNKKGQKVYDSNFNTRAVQLC